jgi:hypothetical protein
MPKPAPGSQEKFYKKVLLTNDDAQNYLCDVIADNVAEYWVPNLQEKDKEQLLMAIPKMTRQIVQMFIF